MALSDELDKQIISGNGTAPNLSGILQGLTSPTDTPAAVALFDDFVGKFSDGVDGLWAPTCADVSLVVGVDTYRVAAKAFRDGSGGNANRGEVAFSDYAMSKYGGFWTNSAGCRRRLRTSSKPSCTARGGRPCRW